MLVVQVTVSLELFLISYMVTHVITCMLANPGHFIESNTKNSWNESLTNMSLQGSWCDALIVQGVA